MNLHELFNNITLIAQNQKNNTDKAAEIKNVVSLNGPKLKEYADFVFNKTKLNTYDSNLITNKYNDKLSNKLMSLSNLNSDGYIAISVPSDGNCLFSTLSVLVFKDQKYQAYVRILIVYSYIKFENYFIDICGLARERYLKLVIDASTLNAWGCGHDIGAFSLIVIRNFVTYELTHDECSVFTNNFNAYEALNLVSKENQQITYLMIFFSSHFSPLLPINAKCVVSKSYPKNNHFKYTIDHESISE